MSIHGSAVALGQPSPRPPSRLGTTLDGRGQDDARLDLLIETVRQAGAHGDRDAEHVALAAWCMVHGVATLVVDGRLTPVHLGLAADDIDGMVEALLNARPLPASASSSPPSRKSDTD